MRAWPLPGCCRPGKNGREEEQRHEAIEGLPATEELEHHPRPHEYAQRKYAGRRPLLMLGRPGMRSLRALSAAAWTNARRRAVDIMMPGL